MVELGPGNYIHYCAICGKKFSSNWENSVSCIAIPSVYDISKWQKYTCFFHLECFEQKIGKIPEKYTYDREEETYKGGGETSGKAKEPASKAA